VLRSERNGIAGTISRSIFLQTQHRYVSDNLALAKQFRRVAVYAQKCTLVLSRQVRPPRVVSFRYIFLAESRPHADDLTRETIRDATLLCGLIIVTKDNRCYRSYYRKIVLISGANKSANKSDHHYCYFCLRSYVLGFSTMFPPSKLGAPCTVTQKSYVEMS